MKAFYYILLLSFLGMDSFAQLPQAINFQGVAVRDGEVLPETALAVTLTIIDSAIAGKVVYEEFHGAKTNEFGSFSLQVGASKKHIGSQKFEDIEWQTGKKYMNIVIDLTANQSDPIDLGTIEMVTVPFAFSAESVTNIHDENAQKGNVLVFDGDNWVPGDTIVFAQKTGMIDERGATDGDLLTYSDGLWKVAERVPLKVQQQIVNSDTFISDQANLVLGYAQNKAISLTLPNTLKHQVITTIMLRDATHPAVIRPRGTAKILGATNNTSDSIKMHSVGDYVRLISDGTNWLIVEQGINMYVNASLTSSQSIPTGVNTNINFNKKVRDTHGALSASTGTLTIPEGMSGMYYLKLSVGVDPAGADWSQDEYVEGKIRVNSTSVHVIARSWEATTVSNSRGVKEAYGSTVLFFNAGDKIELEALHTTGGNGNISYGSFVMYRLND